MVPLELAVEDDRVAIPATDRYSVRRDLGGFLVGTRIGEDQITLVGGVDAVLYRRPLSGDVDRLGVVVGLYRASDRDEARPEEAPPVHLTTGSTRPRPVIFELQDHRDSTATPNPTGRSTSPFRAERSETFPRSEPFTEPASDVTSVRRAYTSHVSPLPDFVYTKRSDREAAWVSGGAPYLEPYTFVTSRSGEAFSIHRMDEGSKFSDRPTST